MGDTQPPEYIVAMSYGCTCPYATDDEPADHASWCRHGEPAAVKVAAWQDAMEQLRLAETTITNWEAVARVHQDEAIRARQMDPVIAELAPLLDGLRPTHARTGHAENAPCGWCRLIAAYDTLNQTREVTGNE